MVSPAESPRPKPVNRWWLVHQWVGLKLSILLGFILFTGTLAVFGHEIDWLIHPAMRVAPSEAAGSVAWPAIARNVALHAPEARIVALDAPLEPWFAARAVIKRPDGTMRFVHLHPTTGAVQGETGWVGAQRILRNMHRHLMMPVKIGVPIVSSLSLLLLVTLVTSFVVYRKWWRGFGRWPRTRDARTWTGDFHRLAGVWSLWFLALMAVTGIWYLAESTVWPAPPHPEPEVAAGATGTAALVERLEPALAAAQAAWPGLEIRRIAFPDAKQGAFAFEGDGPAVLVRVRSNVAWVAADTGQVALTTDGRDLSPHQRISEAADPLHFGTFGGIWTKLIWFLFGLLLTALAVTGVVIHAMRLLKAHRLGAGVRAGLRTALRGMGIWRWPALGLVLTGFALLPSLFQR